MSSLVEPRMPVDGSEVRSGQRIAFEKHSDEILGLCRDLDRRVELELILIVGDSVGNVLSSDALERGMAIEELISQDTESPDVH